MSMTPLARQNPPVLILFLTLPRHTVVHAWLLGEKSVQCIHYIPCATVQYYVVAMHLNIKSEYVILSKIYAFIYKRRF